MSKVNDKNRKRNKRKIHIRKRIHGNSARPRMTVFRSNRHMYVQAIDDDTGQTLASISSLEKDLAGLKNCVADAAKLGEAFGKRLSEKKLKEVVFDRNGYKYHGIVKAIADGTRKAGITF
ncbi:MAG: 50S ribosomal protein L18 [Spirochaetales bacterium]|jgi:large subunit ribosomal protein L18|nr:50S ribosomal protein L18 [Spirochaetales bacterium]